MKNISGKIAEVVSNTEYESLSEEVIHEAKRRIADVIGIGLSGSTTDVGERITEFSATSGKGKATIWGSSQTTSPEQAALANGTMTFHMELDDVHRTSHTHPGVSVIPTALALCEENNLTGKDLILSTVLGYDVEARLGLAVSPSVYVDRTVLAPGILAIFGSATVAAKLLDNDVETIADTLGTATYIGPVAPFESFRLGAPSKDLIMGWASYTGIYAYHLTKAGFGGPKTSIEGEFGFSNTVADITDHNRILNGLGEEFEILGTGIKPYACCRQHHTAIDAIIELRNEHNIDVSKIKKVTHRTFKVGSRGNDTAPTSIQGAKYSAPYTIAIALTYGKAWRNEYSMELIENKDILNLAAKVEVLADEDLELLYDEKWPSIIEITLEDGTVLEKRRDLPKGEPEHAMTDAELKEKFMSLATDKFSDEKAEKLWKLIFKLENLDNISEITSLLK